MAGRDRVPESGSLPTLRIDRSLKRSIRLYSEDPLRWIGEAAGMGPIVAFRFGWWNTPGNIGLLAAHRARICGEVTRRSLRQSDARAEVLESGVRSACPNGRPHFIIVPSSERRPCGLVVPDR